MRIILNSDILYTSRLVRALPSSWDRFARDCASVGAILAVPRTALLEINRRQGELVAIDVAELERASSILASYGVPAPSFIAANVVRAPDIIAMFRATGAKVETLEPTLHDYQAAERRAALHLAPLRPNSEADQMRDLVIWEVACRIAKADAGAVLLSRDHVHSGPDGDTEAGEVGLQRLTSFDAALDVIGVESPRAKLARQALDRILPHLQGSIPISDSNAVRRFTNVSFVQGVQGLARVKFGFRAKPISGALLTGSVSIEASAPDQLRTLLTDLTLDGKPLEPPTVEMLVNGNLPSVTSNVPDLLNDLRELLEQ